MALSASQNSAKVHIEGEPQGLREDVTIVVSRA